MRVKIKGYLKHQNKKDNIETKGILLDKKLEYHFNGFRHIINIEELSLIRENNECKHIIVFNKEYKSHYILKQYKLDMIIVINTIKTKINENSIYIKYSIKESNEIYEYKIEWSLIS